MRDPEAKYWIAEKPEAGKEIPPDLQANSNHGIYQLVMGFREIALAREDFREVSRRSEDTELVLLRFDTNRQIYHLLEEPEKVLQSSNCSLAKIPISLIMRPS